MGGICGGGTSSLVLITKAGVDGAPVCGETSTLRPGLPETEAPRGDEGAPRTREIDREGL